MSTRIILICLLLSGMVLSCEENPELSMDQYPMDPGVVRTYERKASITGDTLMEHTETFNLEVWGTRTLEDGTVLTVLKYTSERDTGYEYFLNNDTALLDYGHQYFASPLPRKKSFSAPYSGSFPVLPVYSEMPEEIFYSTPLKVFSYPLRKGQSWLVTPEQDFPFTLVKKISGKSMLLTPAGSFQGIRIDYEYSGDVANGIVVQEYVSSAGLLKRISVMKDLQFTDHMGEPSDAKQITLTEVITLVAVKTK